MSEPVIKFNLSSNDVSQLKNTDVLNNIFDNAFAEQKAEFLRNIDDTVAAGHHKVTFERSVEEEL